MSLSACPADEIAAPAAVVWSLVERPEAFDRWWDARVIRATPPGPLAPGQHLIARAKGLVPARIHYDVTVVEPNARLQMEIRLPLGIVNHFTMTVRALAADRAFVRFG